MTETLRTQRFSTRNIDRCSNSGCSGPQLWSTLPRVTLGSVFRDTEHYHRPTTLSSSRLLWVYLYHPLIGSSRLRTSAIVNRLQQRFSLRHIHLATSGRGKAHSQICNQRRCESGPMAKSKGASSIFDSLNNVDIIYLTEPYAGGSTKPDPSEPRIGP